MCITLSSLHHTYILLFTVKIILSELLKMKTFQRKLLWPTILQTGKKANYRISTLTASLLEPPPSAMLLVHACYSSNSYCLKSNQFYLLFHWSMCQNLLSTGAFTAFNVLPLWVGAVSTCTGWLVPDQYVYGLAGSLKIGFMSYWMIPYIRWVVKGLWKWGTFKHHYLSCYFYFILKRFPIACVVHNLLFYHKGKSPKQTRSSTVYFYLDLF